MDLLLVEASRGLKNWIGFLNRMMVTYTAGVCFDCMLVLRDKVNSLVTNLRGKIFNDMGDVLR